MTSAGVTDVGKRANNEDALLDEPLLGLFVVADGMGGYDGGEVASRLTVEAVRDFVADNLRDPEGTWPVRADRTRPYDENLLLAAAAAAHRAIVAGRSGRLSRMGSTVVAALVRARRVIVAHVGDSRVYRLRGGVVTQLTRDHSVWAELEALGQGGDRASFPFKNQITRALGIDEASRADVTSLDAEPGDTYLLCSDGLYDPLDEGALREALSCAPADACARLIETALARGTSDNLTAVIFRCS